LDEIAVFLVFDMFYHDAFFIKAFSGQGVLALGLNMLQLDEMGFVFASSWNVYF
jgi:hypothetical protein